MPSYKVLHKSKSSKHTLDRFSLPVVVKPANEGSSIGVSIVEKEEELIPAIEEAFSYDEGILIEEYIKGEDITVGILRDEPLPIVQIKPKQGFYSFRAKYTAGMSDYIVPARIPEDLSRQAQRLGALAHKVLGCRSFSRVDMMLDKKDNKIVVLEVNSIPGLTSTSLLPKAAEAAGIDFAQMCIHIVESALEVV